MLNISVYILILLGFFAFLSFGVIIALILWDEKNYNPPPIGPTGTVLLCNGPGFINQIAPSVYVRRSDRAIFPYQLSDNSPSDIFKSVSNNVQKFDRSSYVLNNINNDKSPLVISSNHWASNTFYGNFNDFTNFTEQVGSVRLSFVSDENTNTKSVYYLYPYYCKVSNYGVDICWSFGGYLTRKCPGPDGSPDTQCDDDNSELIFTADTFDTLLAEKFLIYNNPILSSELSIVSINNKLLSCNILDVDALTTTIEWVFSNPNTINSSLLKNSTGSMKSPMVKGCPYITFNIKNLQIQINTLFIFSLEKIPNRNIYNLKINNTTSGYLIFLSSDIKLLSITNNRLYTETLGTFDIRIAYYTDSTTSVSNMFDILINNHNIYPVECTISTAGNIESENITDFTSTIITTNYYRWTTSIFDTSNSEDDKLLMYSLPNHNIVNDIIIIDIININNQTLGVYNFTLLHINNYYWQLVNTIDRFPLDPFIYNTSTISSDNLTKLQSVCIEELDRLTTKDFNYGINMVNWFEWLSSIANTLLIAYNLKIPNINIYKKFLTDNLELIRINKGVISNSINIVYDITWGGLINNAINNNCEGTTDDGNSFYNSHIGQYGYLLYAYAVAGYIDPDFWTRNKSTAILFLRNIANPYQFDNSFPLWRNKDWYFGYSITSGFQVDDPYGKETNTIGRIVMGYYASYMISRLLSSGSTYNILSEWNLIMLSSEINSLHTYFIFDTFNNIDHNFIQQTISNRFDTAYSYEINSISPNISFPYRSSYIISPLLKPLTLISNFYIDYSWSNNISNYLPMISDLSNLTNEALIYTIAAIFVAGNISQEEAITILNNAIIINPTLDVGSTWSSIYYFVMTYTL